MDVAKYSGAGGCAVNADVLCVQPVGAAELAAVLLDGGADAGDVSTLTGCAARVLELLKQGATPLTAYEAASAFNGIALYLREESCTFAGRGDVRLYQFREGAVFQVSQDDTKAYQAYTAKRLAYEDIRLSPARRPVEEAANPHQAVFALAPGDALLLCTDGFWQMVYETEMEIDLAKAMNAEEWLDAMLLRLAARSRLNADNFTALALWMPQDENGSTQRRV